MNMGRNMIFKYKVGDKICINNGVVSKDIIFTITSMRVNEDGENRYKVTEEPSYSIIENIIELVRRFNSCGCKHGCSNCNTKCDYWESE